RTASTTFAGAPKRSRARATRPRFFGIASDDEVDVLRRSRSRVKCYRVAADDNEVSARADELRQQIAEVGGQGHRSLAKRGALPSASTLLRHAPRGSRRARDRRRDPPSRQRSARRCPSKRRGASPDVPQNSTPPQSTMVLKKGSPYRAPRACHCCDGLCG